jgi:undecaprenyl-diphosphatase
MSILQAIILGIIQGLSEFLPISSSGHLVLAPFIFGWEIPKDQNFVFDVLVQMGTLFAVIVYFRKDLFCITNAFLSAMARRQPFGDPEARLGWYIILATLPAGLFGLLTKDEMEAAFSRPVTVAFELIGTAFLLFFAEWVGRRSRPIGSLNWKDALWIGCAQAISVLPGISRSGSTIAGAMSRHLERPAAARFSFLMSIPIMLAAGLLASLDLVSIPNLSSFLPVVVVGTITSAVVGYLSIHWLLSFLNRNSLKIFAIYCMAVAAIILIVFYV